MRSYDYSKTLFQRETEVLSKLDIDPEIFGYIQYGMYGVLYDAASTLKEHWLDSSIVAAAKTGTAQRGEGLVNNAMFILYAPYGDNPEIAIAIAVEKGGAGRHALAGRAKDRGLLLHVPVQRQHCGKCVFSAEIIRNFRCK